MLNGESKIYLTDTIPFHFMSILIALIYDFNLLKNIFIIFTWTPETASKIATAPSSTLNALSTYKYWYSY